MVTLPWGGKLLNYCPAHANTIIHLGEVMGNTIQVQALPKPLTMQCESNDELTQEQKDLNALFNLQS